jgi:hypothetical protein
VEDFSSQKRRNVATLAVAVSACVILGTFTILKATRKRYILSLFYALEVHLARFEGLVFNSIAIVGRKELLDTLLVYLIGYFERMEMHLINIQKVFLFEESEEFSNSMHEIGESVRAFKDDGFVLTETTDMILGDIEVEKRLLKVLRSLEYLQEIVRRYTRQLER